MKNTKIYKSSILFFEDDPSKYTNIKEVINYISNGILIIQNGIIKDMGEYEPICKKYNIDETTIDNTFEDKLLIPGFIDTHVHYPQTEIIGSFGEQLLPWLEKYTFPTEMKFKDKNYAKEISKIFLKELFKNGTTTAMVFATVYKESVDAIFEEANKYKMRLIAGKVMMDRNAPQELLDDADSSYEDSKELIERWHEKDRLLYAITPRFAPTSTKEQLEKVKELKNKYPSTYIQTHLSENLDEIEWVKTLFPEANSYLDVYDRFSLVTDKSIFAHAIYLEDDEYETLSNKGASVSLCPTSNLFLGSGLFKLRKLKKQNSNIGIGFGSDVGAGTSFSILKTIHEAYKVVSLEQNTSNREALGAFEAFYQATLGAAKSLRLDDKIGKLKKGYEADFIALEFKADDLQKLRIDRIKDDNSIESLEEKLFALMMMGDDRNISATVINGEVVYKK